MLVKIHCSELMTAHLSLEPLWARDTLKTSWKSSCSGQILKAKIWALPKPWAKFIFSRAKTFLSPYHYISWLSTLLHVFLSNFRQTYFSLLTKIFMMNSNYSVVVVSWDLCCGPTCIHSSSVWMHNKEPGWVFVYVWCSLPYPQTFTWRSLNWEVNTKMWIEALVQDVSGLKTAKAW